MTKKPIRSCISFLNMEKAVKILKEGGIGVLGTDTLYGLVGLALSPKAVERIYKIKERDTAKPLIILISSWEDLKLFKVKADKKLLAKYSSLRKRGIRLSASGEKESGFPFS